MIANKFKKGDRLIRVVGYWGPQVGMKEGGVYHVLRTSPRGSITLYGYNGPWSEDSFRLYDANLYEETVMEHEECKCVAKDTHSSWSFTVTAPIAIDFGMIIDTLSYKHPVAFVSAGDREYVCVHDSIFVKANMCKGKHRLTEECINSSIFYFDKGHVYEVTDLCGRREILEYVKKIKNSPWKKKFAGRTTVTVTMPKV